MTAFSGPVSACGEDIVPHVCTRRVGLSNRGWKMECLGSRSRRHGITATGFDPFGVGHLGWNAIRGQRAQTPCPCPRLLNFNPFGVGRATGTNAEWPSKCNNRRGGRKRWRRSTLPPRGGLTRKRQPECAALPWSLCDNCAYTVIPIPQSRERNLALSVFNAVRDSSSSAIKSGGLLGMTRKAELSRRLQGRGLPIQFVRRERAETSLLDGDCRAVVGHRFIDGPGRVHAHAMGRPDPNNKECPVL